MRFISNHARRDKPAQRPYDASMPTIATLTLNPTIDVSFAVERVFHTHKMRTTAEHYAPGGGGINVARVFVRLGGNARCLYMSGGATGPALDGLLDLHQLVRQRIAIAEPTRVSTAVLEHESGKEFRFTPAGPTVSEPEWQALLEALRDVACDCLVASGSLPPGVPDDFYARAGKIMQRRGIAMVLDTSGDALRAGLTGGGLLLVKPSQGELQQLVGRELASRDAIGAAAAEIVAAGQAQLVAVTLGHEGAILAHAGGLIDLPAPAIEAQSAVGAGDSFTAAMVHALLTGRPVAEAFRFGIAGGSAAVLSPGTGLAHPGDIARILPLVGV
jgi:6-phosphofructokinase 2